MTGFKVRYRYRETMFDITVTIDDTLAATQVVVDGDLHEGDALRLVDDRRPHVAKVSVRSRPRDTRRPTGERFGAFH